MTQLALYESAREALAAAVRVDEVVDIRNTAEQAKAYARIWKDRRLQADAHELGARAERKLGIILRRAKLGGEMSQGGRPAERSNLTEETGAQEEPVFDNTPFTLADIGISKKLSSRAQHLAELADDAFERVISDKREKILATDAPIVSLPKKKAVKADKPAAVQPLDPRRFHQFAFSLLTVALASDRVSSKTVFFLARECGIVGLDEDNPELTPEAEKAMGNIVVAALSAIERGKKELPGTADETAGGFPVAAAPEKAEQLGETEATRVANTSDEGTATLVETELARSANAAGQGSVTAGETAAPSYPLPTAAADAIIAAGYANGTPVADIAVAIGRPGEAGKAYVRDRARKKKLGSKDNQRARASAFASAQQAARRGDA